MLDLTNPIVEFEPTVIEPVKVELDEENTQGVLVKFVFSKSTVLGLIRRITSFLPAGFASYVKYPVKTSVTVAVELVFPCNISSPTLKVPLATETLNEEEIIAESLFENEEPPLIISIAKSELLAFDIVKISPELNSFV